MGLDTFRLNVTPHNWPANTQLSVLPHTIVVQRVNEMVSGFYVTAIVLSKCITAFLEFKSQMKCSLGYKSEFAIS